jgi:hypothetical protein
MTTNVRGRKYQVGYHFRSPLPPPVTTTREMPETIITLPPELIIKVFRSLDHFGTALKLSATCRLLYDIWRSNESMLRMELLPFHPVFWEYYNIEPKPDGPAISLWEYALEHENARQGMFLLVGARVSKLCTGVEIGQNNNTSQTMTQQTEPNFSEPSASYTPPAPSETRHGKCIGSLTSIRKTPSLIIMIATKMKARGVEMGKNA